MIHFIFELITYDNNVKNSYTLYIPLQFWFNKYIAASIPLIFLRYNDVRIQLDLNEVRKLIYTDAPSDFNIEESIQLMDVSLYVDYIFLDNDERTKFSQSSLEYLIETTQNYNYTTINAETISLESYFINSVKELFWVAQSMNNINNNFHHIYDLGIIYKVSLINKVITNNLEQKIQLIIGKHILNIGDKIEIINTLNYKGIYDIIEADLTSVTVYSKFYVSESDAYIILNNLKTSITTYGDKNPIISTTYTFEQYNRFENYDANFTNFVEPYKYHTKTPSDGINIYSFSLNPEDYQPSGSANFSAYKYKSIFLKFNKKTIDFINQNNDTLIVKTYALGYNILSFKNGMAGLVFNI